MKIAIFHHSLFFLNDGILPQAVQIVFEQMELLKSCGLEDAATEIHCGINGTPAESGVFARSLLPAKATKHFHGLQCRNENRSIVMIERTLPFLPDDCYCLYFHAKGSTHPPDDLLRKPWAHCMTRHLVSEWRNCVSALNQGYDAVGCHYMEPPATPLTQYIFAGNFFWATASFLRTLPSIMKRERIKDSGIDAVESRYESEVWIGNGPRPPKVMDYCPNWHPGLPHA